MRGESASEEGIERDRSSRRRKRRDRGLRKQALQTRETVTDGLDDIIRRVPAPLKRRRNQLVIGAVATTVLLVAGGRIAYWNTDRDLPSPSLLSSFRRQGTLVIKAADGSVLQQTGDSTREKVSIDKLPKNVVNAFIAAEDRRFYEHNGVDLQGIARALVRNVRSGGVAEGGSTITQQVARMAFLNQDRSLVRKWKEAVLAQKLEREIDKPKLLEHYLNLVYLGSEAYGISDAAWVYFSKSVDELTLAETAMIAGLPPAPSAYSPLINKDAAKQRRNLVLDRMEEQGFITSSEASKAKSEKITLKQETPKNLYSSSPYFTDYVRQELPKLIDKEDLQAGGLLVETTLNPRWQKIAAKAVRSQTGSATGPKAFQGALVAVDPSNGEIRAMVGGKDYYGDGKKSPDDKYKGDQFNRATKAMRQPGSTFKMFVYTAAVAAGFSPYKSYKDAPFHVDGYEPKNYGDSYSGSLNMRQALTKSANVVAVKILIDVGFDPVIRLAKNMGLTTKLEPVYSMALGSYEVNLVDLTSSYGTLAAEGMHAKAHGIRKVTNSQGKVIYKADFKPKRVVDEGTSSIMTWMLENVVTSGTGQPASLPDRQVAGKTGTSEKTRDLWFVGYIPQLVTGVWLGYDDSYPTGGSSGMAAAVWRRFMRDATKDITIAKFPDLPNNLDTRKGSIKSDPVKTNRRYNKKWKGNEKKKRRRRRNSDDGYASASRSYSKPRYYAPKPKKPKPYYPPPQPAYNAPAPKPYYPAPKPYNPPAPKPYNPPPAAPAPPPMADPAPPPLADPGAAAPAPPM
ncbi:penicillin-binding protein 1A [filamentous cyanobacterium LEGE 11480]|uniref:Penicillin-binding protein 1A n=2 Tax=Romeriopsis TaxID=2992131 RepID=A0A928Z2K7_9CYAN|nr:penicillin-binding protein 1A [Romeriopsis navalis LEGE 11480]